MVKTSSIDPRLLVESRHLGGCQLGQLPRRLNADLRGRSEPDRVPTANMDLMVRGGQLDTKIGCGCQAIAVCTRVNSPSNVKTRTSCF